MSQVTVEAASGGGSSNPTASPKEVNFYDYDGTILYSYTIEEAQALTELPPLPTREGLVCQGWNYDLVTIKEHNRAVDVGATYITDDGKTRLYIKIAAEGRMTVPLYFNQTVANGIIIDWGDGSATETLAGTGNVNTSHAYANIGDYVISLEVTSGALKLGNSMSSCCIMGPITSNRGSPYSNMLQKVELGNGITDISTYAFQFCLSLASITLPNNVTNLGVYAFRYCQSLTNIIIPNSTYFDSYIFHNCYSLRSAIMPGNATNLGTAMFYSCISLSNIMIPDSVISLGNYTFSGCYCLTSIIIPNSITYSGNSTFSPCYGMAIYDFTLHTSVPTLSNTDAFSGIPSDCEIRVPAALYDEWIAATNWSTYASQIVAV